MAIINIEELSGFPRKVKVIFPNPKVANATLETKIDLKFTHLDDDEHKELFSVDPVTKKLVHSQREICEKIITWINPESVKGAESSEQAKNALVKNIAFQNAAIDDFGECQSGFTRKNLRG